MDWDAGQYKSPLANVITIALLATLQGLNIFWLYCLLRSAYRFLVHNIAKDDRSDTSEEEDEELEEVDPKDEMKKLELNANGSANGVLKVTGNQTASLPTKRKSAR